VVTQKDSLSSEMECMINFIKSLFKKKKAEPVSDPALPPDLVWQTMLLNDDDLLVFTDENRQIHYFTKKPLDPDKEYRVLIYE